MAVVALTSQRIAVPSGSKGKRRPRRVAVSPDIKAKIVQGQHLVELLEAYLGGTGEEGNGEFVVNCVYVDHSHVSWLLEDAKERLDLLDDWLVNGEYDGTDVFVDGSATAGAASSYVKFVEAALAPSKRDPEPQGYRKHERLAWQRASELYSHLFEIETYCEAMVKRSGRA